MLDSIYHMTLKSHFAIKRYNFATMYAMLLWTF